ncbi:magnesium transporter CorA family protein [Butyrivibrio sp. MC2013]|uniref:magnesium transporter CorA family protein n=1 Tax=Butyrivibrio sp. MC2013 TaxID=1280686 RepID=UPI0004192B4E|nr:CorA family divalent cation transporter [Butyrivibrio sp. MC2013]
MIYRIEENLKEITMDELPGMEEKYVAVLSLEEWRQCRDRFDMGIEIEPELETIYTTKAEVNYDSITGTFSIPDRHDFSRPDKTFSFALDEKGIVFIDDTGKAAQIIAGIQATRRWKLPSLERFIYDFLDQIVKDDLGIMEEYERELDAMEHAILNEEKELSSERVNDIRSDIRDLRIHYEQLMDFGQELEENENDFFYSENLRYFRLFLNRIARLHDTSTALRDYTMQIRDLYKAHLDIKQNRIMTVLTVVTTIFLPLTLIVGWYGMNFKYMPELEWRWGYPVVIASSIVIVVGSLLFFRSKKWL